MNDCLRLCPDDQFRLSIKSSLSSLVSLCEVKADSEWLAVVGRGRRSTRRASQVPCSRWWCRAAPCSAWTPTPTASRACAARRASCWCRRRAACRAWAWPTRRWTWCSCSASCASEVAGHHGCRAPTPVATRSTALGQLGCVMPAVADKCSADGVNLMDQVLQASLGSLKQLLFQSRSSAPLPLNCGQLFAANASLAASRLGSPPPPLLLASPPPPAPAAAPRNVSSLGSRHLVSSSPGRVDTSTFQFFISPIYQINYLQVFLKYD